MFFSSIQPIGQQFSQALTAMAGAERVFRLLDTKPDWEEPPNAIDLHDPRVGADPRVRPGSTAKEGQAQRPAPTGTLGARVEFRSVIFGYGTDRPALNDISFGAEPGQTVALVGHTGSGKSSMINLITNFSLPQQGEVLIDGFDTREILGDSLHRQMGIVSQQNFLF